LKDLKNQLYQYCHHWVDKKIALAQNEIKSAQSSANEETKSSAGDKYETGRAMAQLEIEKNSSQLAQAYKLKQQLNEFSAETNSEFIKLGSLVKTNSGLYYLSVSAGKVVIDNHTCICLSPASPLGGKMIGLKAGSSFNFNGQDHTIREVR
jgi:hypothetical protein